MWNRNRRVVLSILVALFCVAPGCTTVIHDPDPPPPVPEVDGVITIYSSRRYQTIQGWGTCLVAWQQEFRDLYRTSQFQDVYVNDLGFNVVRINLWGPTSRETVEDWRDIKWQDLDFEGNPRAQIFIDFCKAVLELDPEAKFIGSVWSPPAWMKVNRSITDTESGAIGAFSYQQRGGDRVIDNRVSPRYFRHFAKWMVEMVKAHDEMGAPLYAISPCNEPQFTQTFESCVWTAEDLATIIELLGDMLEEEGYGHVKIFAPLTMTGHFYRGGTPDYIRILAEHEGAAKYFDAIATHGYSDGVRAEIDVNVSRRLWERSKDYGRPFWITEGGTRGHEWPEPIRQGVANMFHNALVAGHTEMVVPWQVTGRNPTTHNLMVMNEFTPKTYAVMHFTRFIRPGAVRIGAEPGYGQVLSSAFLHDENGILTIVLINPGEQELELWVKFNALPHFDSMQVHRTSRDERMQRLPDVEISRRNRGAALTLPPHSIVTLQGRGGGE